jgi:acyl transferase domain-containing protein
MLETAGEALGAAGLSARGRAPKRTDVIGGSCFGFDRSHVNALRVQNAKVIEHLAGRRRAGPPESERELRRTLKRRLEPFLLGAPHDRLGEMASSAAALISIAFGLEGACTMVEAGDGTAFVALKVALTRLALGHADLAVVVVGQRLEHPLVHLALARKGLLARERMVPFSASQRGFLLGEGVAALTLRRVEDAERAGDRIWGIIRAVAASHDDRPGTLRYSLSRAHRVETIREAWRSAQAELGSAAFVECAGSCLPREQACELEAVAEACAGRNDPPLVGCVRETLGHTFATSGLSAIIKVLLSLHRGVWLPQHTLLGHAEREPALNELRYLQRPQGFRVDSTTAVRAGVNAATLGGSLFHAVLEGPPPRARPHVRARSALRDRSEPIAIVAAEGRFGGAEDAAALWRKIQALTVHFRELPEEMLDSSVYFDASGTDLHRTYTTQGAPLPEPNGDSGSRLPPARRRALDVAQRHVLELGRLLLANYAGREALGRCRRGAVIVATNLTLRRERELATGLDLDWLRSRYEDLVEVRDLPDPDRSALLDDALSALRSVDTKIEPWTIDGCLASATASMLANELGLHAVPFAIEAACASSMAAFATAVDGLRDGQFDYAIAGGVELPCNVHDLVLCSALRILSRGKMNPLGPAADGFTAGDGVALFVLKRYTDALRDQDDVFAVIRAVGTSSDASSLVAPDVGGQERAIRDAFAQVEFGPRDVQQVELHGTGTVLGDQVESLALAKTYADPMRSEPLVVSAVKSMVGHTFSAAGAAGLLASVLSLRHRTFLPTASLDEPNPWLCLASIPAVVCRRAIPWPEPASGPRRAGVSSFGTGGINYHMLLEEEREDKPWTSAQRPSSDGSAASFEPSATSACAMKACASGIGAASSGATCGIAALSRASPARSSPPITAAAR